MGNKLRNVFSNKEVTINAKINFKDNESYNVFLEALNKVEEDGVLVKVDGIESVETIIKRGDAIYPVNEHEHISDFIVAPSKEKVSFELDTIYGKKVLDFERIRVKKGVVLQTSESSVVFLKFLFENQTEKSKISYRAQPEKAKSIKELIESYSIVLALFEKLFSQDFTKIEDGITIKSMKEYFERAIEGYKKLEFVENEFGVSFTPCELTQNEECWLDLEELYLTLKKDMVFRLNAKVDESETNGMHVNQSEENLKIGSELDITFLTKVDYSLWTNTITLHAACLLSNAIIKKINHISKDEIKILYGSEDSRPMYISYKGFKTEEEAQKEMSSIIEHKHEYEEALTVREYVNKRILKK